MPNFKLELKKIMRSKKIILTLFISVLISSSLFYWNHTNLDGYGRDLFSNMSAIKQELSATRTQYRERMTEVGLIQEEIMFHMTLFTEMENQMIGFEHIKHYDHRYEIPGQMVLFYEAYEKYSEDRTENANGRQFFHLYDGYPDQIESEKAFFQELVDHGLPYEDPVYSLYGPNLVKSVMNVAFGVILALFILIMVVDIFSEEKVNGTEKIRQIQPVKRINILISKLFASLTYVLGFLVFTCIVSYILAGLMGSGFGSIYYPIQSYYGFESIGVSVGEYMGLGILYYSLYIFFILSCIALFAAIIKETYIVAVLGIIMVIIGDGWGLKTPSYFNPFSYIDFDNFIVGSDGHPFIMSGIVLVISTLVIFLTHYLTQTTWVQNFTFTLKARYGEGALLKYEKKKTLPLTYFRFEVLKIIKKKTTTIPFILLLIIVGLFGLSENSRYEEIRNTTVSEHQSLAYQYEGTLARQEQFIAEEELDPEILEIKEKELERFYVQYNQHVNAVEAYKSGDVEGIIQAQKDHLQFASESHGALPIEAKEVEFAQLEEIKERLVQPVMSNSINLRITSTSPFAMESNFRSNWNVSFSQPSITYIFNSLFKNGLGLLLLAIFAMSLALGFSDETHDTRTIYLLNTQPLHHKRIYFGKLFAQSVVFIGMVAILVVTLFIGLRFNGNPLERNFPAVQYQNQIDEEYTGVALNRRMLTENRGKSIPASASSRLMGFTFRDMNEENKEMVAMLLLSGLVIISFAMLISLWIRNKIGVSLGTALVFGLGYLASRYFLQGLGTFLPFIWLNQPLIASGEASMIFNVTKMNSLIGLLILLSWLMVIVYIGYRKFSKQNGRC